MLWINFLHCYQPANIDAHIIKEATEKSYARIIRAVSENKDFKVTLNINGSLFLRWEELGYLWLIEKIRELVKVGKIELTGTACYHPLMPLIPEQEVRKQISENEEILCRHFGESFKATGFFLPEMAYSESVAGTIKDFGYKWIILDEIALGGELGKVDYNKIYKDKKSGLKVIFRNRNISSTFVPNTLKTMFGKELDYPIITATDGELYGLRHIDPSAEFEKILKEPKLETKTISEFINSKKETVLVNITACNWESVPEELKNNKPYSLWYDEEKKIQQDLWELANLAYKVVESHPDDDNYNWARWHLVRGFASCTFWWASEKDFSQIFGPYAWSPDEIERGANELIRSVRTLENTSTRNSKIKAEEFYMKIKKEVWNRHWAYHWKKKNK